MATVKNTLLYDISDVAHTAQTTASSAATAAANAQTTANAAQSLATQAQSTAAQAQSEAASAYSLAQGASTAAQQAAAAAVQAQATADQAISDAAAASSQAADASAAAGAVASNLARVYYTPLGSFSAVEFVAACARPKILGAAAPQAITLTIADALAAGYANDWTNADPTLRYSGSAKIVNLRGTHIDWTLTDQNGQSISKRQDSGETMVLYYSPVDGWVSLVSQF